MHSRDLYKRILGVEAPWVVTRVDFLESSQSVEIRVEHGPETPLCCPLCGRACSGYDTRPRRWRHLDTCQYPTILACDVPRISCEEHGVRQVAVPWSDPGSRFTAFFEKLVIDWLHEASLSAVARLLGLSWSQVDSIMARAVTRGLSRRKKAALSRIAVDETSFQKRHEYVTVVTNQDGNRVEYVADGRGKDALDGFWKTLSAAELQAIDSVSMDMWRPYMRSTKDYVPQAEEKICFDKFHVAKHLGDAVDRVRRAENRVLGAEGDECLKGSKYLWLQNPLRMSRERWSSFTTLRTSSLKTARAWHLKEVAMQLWNYSTRGWGRKAWKKWLGWALRCRLEPMRKAAKMIRRHLEGILNAMVMEVTNAGSESINAKIQKVKRMACGFRNRDRFRNAIYFHCGGLNMDPEGVTHTKS